MMHLVLTTYDRKPPYVHETLRALFRHGRALDLGGRDRLTILCTESRSIFTTQESEEFCDHAGCSVHWLDAAQLAERNRMSPRQRTKLCTRLALELGADVVLQDDLDFAPDWWPRFNALLPIDTSKLCVSLYYPQPAKSVGLVQWQPREYYGMQSMFFGEDARAAAIEYLKDPREEADDNALARMLTHRHDLLLYACVPSLIQHTGVTSSLKSRMHRAPTFGLTIEECNAWMIKVARQPIRWPTRGR